MRVAVQAPAEDDDDDDKWCYSMQSEANADPARLQSRLTIHAGDDAPTAAAGWGRVLQGWRLVARCAVPDRHAIAVSVGDLKGHTFLLCDDARSRIDVPLPAGTYRINVQTGTLLRQYTVTLESGAAVELRVR